MIPARISGTQGRRHGASEDLWTPERSHGTIYDQRALGRLHGTSDDPKDQGAASVYQRRSQGRPHRPHRSQGPRGDPIVLVTTSRTQQQHHGTSDHPRTQDMVKSG